MWKPSPYLLFRMGGLDQTVLKELKLNETTHYLDKYLKVKDWLSVNKDTLFNERLYKAIANVDGEVKSSLVAIKRALYNERVPKIKELEFLKVINYRLRREVLKYCSRIRKGQNLLAKANETYEKEVAEIRTKLQHFSSNEEFLKTLQIAAPSLYKKTAALITTDVCKWRKKERQTAQTTARYLIRTASKTSPFGRFSPVALGEYSSSQKELFAHDYQPQDNKTRASLSLNVCHKIIQIVANHPEFVDDVYFELNSTIVENNSEVSFLQPKEINNIPAYSSYRKGRAIPIINTVINIFKANQKITLEHFISLYEQISSGPKVDRDKILGLIDNLTQSGMLIRTLNIDTNSLNKLAALENFLEKYNSDYANWFKSNIAKLQGFVRCYANESLSVRKRNISLALAVVNKLLGKEYKQNELGSIFTEDTYSVNSFKLGPVFFDKISRDIDLFLDCISLRDRGGLNHLSFKDMFVDTFGEDGVCDDINSLFKIYSNSIYTANHNDTQYFARTSKAHENALSYMNVLLEDIHKHRESSVCQIEHSKVAALIEQFFDPALNLKDRSVTLHLQIVADNEIAFENGDFDVVVNYTLPGYGRFFSRYCQLYQDGSLEQMIKERIAQLSKVEGMPFVEIQSILNNNTQVHPKLTEKIIAMPGEESTVPSEQRITFDQIQIKHCKEKDHIQFYADGKPFVPIYMGFFHGMALPACHRLFLDGTVFGYHAERNKPVEFHENLLPFVTTLEEDQKIRHYPRTKIGRVIIQRETWCVYKDSFPKFAASESDFSIHMKLHRWRVAHAIPEESFIKIKREQINSASNLYSVNKIAHKPIFFDFNNIFTVKDLVKTLGEEDVISIQFEEVLPKVCSNIVEINEKPFTAELQVEFNRGAYCE